MYVNDQLNRIVEHGWPCLASELDEEYWARLRSFLDRERSLHTIYPPAEDVFRALALTSLDKTKVVIVGQDPYPGPGKADGLCFSVRRDVRSLPPSLRNIRTELLSDWGTELPPHGSLERWAAQGVLLINTLFTVRQCAARSHRASGWRWFADAVIRCVKAKEERVVFLAWGRDAQKVIGGLDASRHVMISTSHPSPRSARVAAPIPFLGSHPFTKANEALESEGLRPIEWSLND